MTFSFFMFFPVFLISLNKQRTAIQQLQILPFHRTQNLSYDRSRILLFHRDQILSFVKISICSRAVALIARVRYLSKPTGSSLSGNSVK